jgi:uncharacterized protein YjiS (DUF1127 family)
MHILHIRLSLFRLFITTEGAYIAKHQIRGRRAQRKGQMTIKSITEKLAAWRHYRISVRELSQLSDRELHDLGLTRGEIDYVARRSAGL